MSHDCQAAWDEVIRLEQQYAAARMRFMKECDDKISIWRAALPRVDQRGEALRLLLHQPAEAKLALFTELLSAASFGHRDIALVRDVLLSIPREQLVRELESAVPRLLENGGDEEYRRILELLHLVDPGLTRTVAQRAAAHSDPHIREIGEDFME